MIGSKSAFPRRAQSSEPASQKATPTQQTSNCQQGRREGERRKRRTLTALEARREWFVLRGRRVLLRRALDGGSATMDDVRDAVTLPPNIDAKLFGAVPGPLATGRIIRADGYVRTSRAAAHSRPVTVWRLMDRDAAERWLADHPDRADELRSENVVTRFADGLTDLASAAMTQRTLFKEGGRP